MLNTGTISIYFYLFLSIPTNNSVIFVTIAVNRFRYHHYYCTTLYTVITITLCYLIRLLLLL